MPKTTWGANDGVTTDSGFGPYEGPLPKPGTAYEVVLKQASFKLTGDKAKTPGVQYVKTLWEITEGECKGYGAWYNLVPGEHEIQEIRIAQFMQAACGQNSAPFVHEPLEAGGKISKIGGKSIDGVKARMTFRRVADRNDPSTMVAETADIIPLKGGAAKKVDAVLEEPVGESEDEDMEEVDEVMSWDDANAMSLTDLKNLATSDYDISLPKKGVTKAAVLALLVEGGYVEEPEPEEEPADQPAPELEPESPPVEPDVDEGNEEDEAVSLEDAERMTLVDLKNLALDFEYEEADLAAYKGPKGKKALLALMLEEGVLEATAAEDEPPF